MGAWGTALYSNDTASDIRGDYVDLLRRGNSNQEALKKLMEKDGDCIGIEEEEPLFWYALADTLWNYGRLTPEVKEKALYFLDHPEAELARWEDDGGKYVEAWMRTLEKLRTKLLSPQPPEKKVSKYRLYKCTWQVGDVYAYRLESEYSKEKGLYGKYIIFQKVGETDCWPGHIIPIVVVYRWIGAEIPRMEELRKLEFLNQIRPVSLMGRTQEECYHRELVCESEKKIPVTQLILLGNQKPREKTVVKKDRCNCMGWEKTKINWTIEKETIDLYLAWQEHDNA